MENESFTSKKNTFKLPFMGTAVELSGDFDSGNLNTVNIDLQKNVHPSLFRNYNFLLGKIKMSRAVIRFGFIFGYRLILISRI